MLSNTAARRSIPGFVIRNSKNFNKKAPELKLVGYPFLYIPVNIPPCFAAARTTMSPRPCFVNVCDAAAQICMNHTREPPHVNRPNRNIVHAQMQTACQVGEMWPNDTPRNTDWSNRTPKPTPREPL